LQSRFGVTAAADRRLDTQRLVPARRDASAYHHRVM
jgi:hypothetical protein